MAILGIQEPHRRIIKGITGTAPDMLFVAPFDIAGHARIKRSVLALQYIDLPFAPSDTHGLLYPRKREYKVKIIAQAR